jgi:N-acetylmuramoyl-L-alanine amidase
MRKITHIVVHCTATPQNASVESIQKYWRDNLKWISPGYHRIIKADGTIAILQPYDKPTNGVAGHNATSIHISYIGGVDKNQKPVDNRTDAQVATMVKLLQELTKLYPNAKVQGHRDFPGVAKACPSFDAPAWWATVSRYSNATKPVK